MILAYIDPGAGSLIFQALLAAALTVPFFLRSKISAVIHRLRGSSVEETPTTSVGDETRRS